MTQKTVLVVDDEPLVRLVLVEFLQNAGFATLEAGCADEAIQVLRTNDNINIVFTDIQMPGAMDGVAFAHYVQSHWPVTQIVIISGNSKPPANRLPVLVDYIAKPFAGAELDRVCRALAD